MARRMRNSGATVTSSARSSLWSTVRLRPALLEMAAAESLWVSGYWAIALPRSLGHLGLSMVVNTVALNAIHVRYREHFSPVGTTHGLQPLPCRSVGVFSRAVCAIECIASTACVIRGGGL